MAGIAKYNHELIYLLLKQGLMLKDIAARLGCSIGAVKGVRLKKENPEEYKKGYKTRWLKIRDKKNKNPEERWKKTKPRIGNYEEIVVKYKDGKTILEIAEEYNCHYSTIKKIVRKYE